MTGPTHSVIGMNIDASIKRFETSLPEKYKIAEIMRCNFCPPLPITASVEDVVSQSQQQNFVPIVDDRNIFIGIVTRKDVIRYLAELALQSPS